jgi:L-ribulose-5-phosphate 4-epimerase
MLFGEINMFDQIKEEVSYINKQLKALGLVKLTWGNASAISPDRNFLVIKPSGVDYETMMAKEMVIVDMQTGAFEGLLNPSTDLPTHRKIYQDFPEVKAIIHTHSKWATIFAQAGKNIPVYGTTHADHFHGPVPVTRPLNKIEVQDNYEENTGKLIAETFEYYRVTPTETPGILVNEHGSFVFGQSLQEALNNAIALEEIAFMAYHTEILKQNHEPIQAFVIDKHFYRKHGSNAYYGQNKEETKK